MNTALHTTHVASRIAISHHILKQYYQVLYTGVLTRTYRYYILFSIVCVRDSVIICYYHYLLRTLLWNVLSMPTQAAISLSWAHGHHNQNNTVQHDTTLQCVVIGKPSANQQIAEANVIVQHIVEQVVQTYINSRIQKVRTTLSSTQQTAITSS